MGAVVLGLGPEARTSTCPPGEGPAFAWRSVSSAGNGSVAGCGLPRTTAPTRRWLLILVRSQIRVRSTLDSPACINRSGLDGSLLEPSRTNAELTACSAFVAAKSSERLRSRTTRAARAWSKMTRAQSPCSASSRTVGSRSNPPPRSTAMISRMRSGPDTRGVTGGDRPTSDDPTSCWFDENAVGWGMRKLLSAMTQIIAEYFEKNIASFK